MSREAQLDRILRGGVIAVVRSARGERLVDVARALVTGGVEAVEVTLTVPGAIRIIEKVADELGDAVLVGAGTVLDADAARSSLLAGAQFIVSPCLNLEVIELCRQQEKLVMPGAFTPTEVVAAWRAGADVVKIFPSDSVGPGYLQALRGPLPQIRMMPTGGVNLENAAQCVRSGACALGVGGSLVSQADIDAGNVNQIEQRARQFVKTVREARAG